MKIRIPHLVLVAALFATNASCYYIRSPVLFPPALGSGFTEIGVPVDTTFHETDMSGRQGHSASHCVLGCFAWGDATVDSAARNGGLQVVEQVDCNIRIVLLGLYSEYETIVTGH